MSTCLCESAPADLPEIALILIGHDCEGSATHAGALVDNGHGLTSTRGRGRWAGTAVELTNCPSSEKRCEFEVNITKGPLNSSPVSIVCNRGREFDVCVHARVWHALARGHGRCVAGGTVEILPER